MNLSGFSTSGRFWGFDYTIHTSESYLLHNLRSSSFSNLLQRKRVKGGGNSFSEEFFMKNFENSSSISVSYFGLMHAMTHLCPE